MCHLYLNGFVGKIWVVCIILLSNLNRPNSFLTGQINFKILNNNEINIKIIFQTSYFIDIDIISTTIYRKII